MRDKNNGSNIRLGAILMWVALLIGIGHAAHVTYRDHGYKVLGVAKPAVTVRN